MLNLKAYLKPFSMGILVMAALGSAKISLASEILSQPDRAIIPVAAFAASGDIERLKVSLNRGLDAGLTVNQLKEILVQLYAYAGFPRSLNGLAALMGVLEERKQQGIDDVQGASSSPLPSDKTALQLGTANQTQLVGMPVTGALFDFAPQIDQYLKAHLFGDIFARDVLSWRQRELATIAMLANISGVNSQLAAHYNISLHNQISVAELKQFIQILHHECGASIAANAQQVLDQVLHSQP